MAYDIAFITKAWLALSVQDRITVLGADREAIELAWLAGSPLWRKRFAARYGGLVWALVGEAERRPPGADVDLVQRLEALRRAQPRDVSVEDMSAAFEALAPYLPKGKLPGGM